MKLSAVLIALAASVVSGQMMYNNTGCTTTSTRPATITVTDVITSTYCPVCDSAKSTNGVYTTTYETVYASVCPTGITSVKYTVTQTCTGTTPINTATCPPQFTAVTTVCTACPGSPIITVTQPCVNCAPTAPVVTPAVVTPVPCPTCTPTVSKPAQFTGAASMVSSNGIGALAGIGSVFFGMLFL